MIVFLCFSFSGCLFSSVNKQVAIAPLIGVPTGKIVNRQAIIKNGTVAILPFRAGEGVSADPQLDRMSMMISKGIIDYLNEQKLPIKVLTTQDQGIPDMVIEGYIENFKRPGKLSRLIFRNKLSAMKISGQMNLVKNKERLIVFNQTKSLSDPKQDGVTLAYQMGQDLGLFLSDALNTE